jgi:hypothetical protein
MLRINLFHFTSQRCTHSLASVSRQQIGELYFIDLIVSFKSCLKLQPVRMQQTSHIPKLGSFVVDSHLPLNPLSAAVVYIRQILKFPKPLQNVLYIYRGIKDTKTFEA